MAKRGMPRIPICENWLIYWGACRKFRKKDIAEMAGVCHVTIGRRLRDLGVVYKANHAVKKRKDRPPKIDRRYKRMERLIKAPGQKAPPWTKGSTVSLFLVGLREFSKSTDTPDVGKYMKQFRKEISHGLLQNNQD